MSSSAQPDDDAFDDADPIEAECAEDDQKSDGEDEKDEDVEEALESVVPERTVSPQAVAMLPNSGKPVALCQDDVQRLHAFYKEQERRPICVMLRYHLLSSRMYLFIYN
jgi:hypothetical protein